MILTCGKHEFNTQKSLWHKDLMHGSRCPAELAYDRMSGLRRCGRHLYPKGREIKRWAAVIGNTPQTREIFLVGIGPAWERFNKGVFSFSCQSFSEWVELGAQYCELFIDDFSAIPTLSGGQADESTLLSDFPHGDVRKCKDIFFARP